MRAASYGTSVSYAVYLDTERYAWSSSVVAECVLPYGPTFKERYVHVRRDAWDQFDEQDKENTIWHELGHCSLGREHDETLYKDGPWRGCPASLMYPYVDVIRYCQGLHGEPYTDYLRKELFTHG